MLKSPSVLLVNDEDELVDLYRESLKRKGFDAISFTDPLLALEHFYRNPDKYSVIISNLKLPKMDGIELAKEIRHYNQRLKIILITDYFDFDTLYEELSQDCNITAVYQKPRSLKELVTRVQEILNEKDE